MQANDTVIRVENLGKRYRLGVARHDTLRDRLSHAMRGPLRRLRGAAPAETGTFWALQDVSFSVRRGEVIGIVGRNGAGKSTLLKILSRITEPTTGEVGIRGRVASLLEVGTGFHAELTGRDNIFLNGAILGMSRGEIRRKFDEIVAFAEVERFLDTPVKHYSSGMYVRLAFAVAAHLEPDILIIDEVLAVGDATFQKKCLGKMEEVAQQHGRTVLFVSHNAGAIQRLCSRSILLQGGALAASGPTGDVLERYQRAGARGTARLDLAQRSHGSGLARITDGSLVVDGEGEPGTLVRHGARFGIEVDVEVSQPCALCLEAVLRDPQGVALAFHSPGLVEQAVFTLAEGTYQIRCDFTPPPLAEGTYTLDVALAQPGTRFLDYLEGGFVFHVPATAIGPMQWNFQHQRGQGSILLPGTQRVINPLV